MSGVVRWLVWFVLLWWLWLLLAGEWNGYEWVAATCAAAFAATLGEVARRAAEARARVGLKQIARAWNVPPVILADFGIVVWALVASALQRRVVRGVFRAREFAAGGDDVDSVGLRVFTTMAATYSPNAYVVDIDVEQGLVLVHDLVPWKPSEEPAA